MVKVKKFRKVWPHKRHKRPKKRRSADKRNIPNNLNPLTKENTQNIRIPNSNQCFNAYPNDPNDFKLKDEDIDNSFSCLEIDKENELINFSIDDPSYVPEKLDINVNESFFENDKIS